MINIINETLKFSDRILNSLSWFTHRLKMTREHFIQFQEGCSNQLSCKGVYIHLDAATNKAIRIGTAIGKDGVYGRWFKNSGCHKDVFCGKKNDNSHRNRYPKYYNFFSQLKNKDTILAWAELNKQEALLVESLFINSYKPVWEDFMVLYRKKGEHPQVELLLEEQRPKVIIKPSN